MKKILFLLLFVVIAGFLAYNYVMAAPKEIATTSADVVINASILAKEFSVSESVATEKYGEKVIEVKGKITAIEGKSVTLDDKISCIFKENVSVKKGNIIKIKGLLIGYDEMFEVVKLDQSFIVK